MAMTFDPIRRRSCARTRPAAADDASAEARSAARGGMHGVAIIRFTPELAHWDPETFVRSVLVEWLHVAEVWVGGNFLFGHDRTGNFSMLRSLGARYGFRAEKIDPVRYKEFVVSSTRVRRLIAEGRVDEAGARAITRAGGTVWRGRSEAATALSTAICAPRTSSCLGSRL